jgi:hypothetical protein
MEQKVGSAGDGSRSGETRSWLMQHRETTRLKLLTRALEQHPDQGWRPVWSMPEREKLSSVRTLCLPHSDTSMSPAEFAECVARHLCLSSPVCVGRVGEMLAGRKRVDRYGDEVCSANLPGNGHKIKHDEMKLKLLQLMRWAAMAAECEPFGLFSRVIPQEGLARMERGRKRQGIIPDYKLSGGGTGSNATLADLKLITGTVGRYPRNPGPCEEPKKNVERRAALVTTEYSKKAVNLDVKYCGVPRAARGRVQHAALARYSAVKGWCFGIHGEASNTVHTLLHKIVEARLLVVDQQPGRRGKVRKPEAEKAHLVGSVRWQVSFMAVRANAWNLISRMDGHVGPGAAEAAKRRQFALATDRQQGRERRAQQLATRQGRSILKRGCFRKN